MLALEEAVTAAAAAVDLLQLAVAGWTPAAAAAAAVDLVVLAHLLL
jgi:hypothetical protein